MGTGASGARVEWSSSMLTLYVGLVVGILVLVGLAVIVARMRKIRKECRETIAKRYNSQDIVCHDNLANYLGLEIFKGKQSRGKGVLLLAQDELYFFRLHPVMELCIPLKRIIRIVTPTKFLNISSPTPLLQVNFQQEDGTSNSVAWKIGDVTSFTHSLKLQRKKVQTRRKK